MVKKQKLSEIQLLEAEIQKGNVDAFYNLGYCYLIGEGVEASPEKALGYFRRGASHQDGKCMQAIAMCYRNGDGVEKDEHMMIQWLKKGAALEDEGCCYQLGLCLEEGRGIEKNHEEAIKMMQIGAKMYPEAKAWLKQNGIATPNFLTKLFGGKR